MKNWSATIDRYIAEGRTVSGGKGDKTAQASEQQSLTLQKQMADLFTKQYGDQSQITKFLTSKLEPILSDGGQGYSPQALAAMRGQATDTISKNYDNAQKQLQGQEFALNGANLGSGVNAQLNAQLAGQRASDLSGAQNQITLANENQRQQDFWASVNALSGNAATINPQSYATGSSASAGQVANAGQVYQQSKSSQLLGALGGLAGGAGTALAGYFTGGASLAGTAGNGFLSGG